MEYSLISEWVARLLEELGHEVVVADPDYAPMYAQRSRRVKTDKRDARALAEACRLGAYRPAHRTSDQQCHVRGLLTVRDSLVRTRARFVTLAQAIVSREGFRVATGSSGCFGERAERLELPEPLTAEIAPLLTMLSPLNEQIGIMDEKLSDFVAVAEQSVIAGCRMKGIDPDSPLASEEWLAGPVMVVRNLRLLSETLTRLDRGLPALDHERIRSRPDGRSVVDVFPTSRMDAVLLPGFSAEVRMKPGVTLRETLERAGHYYKTPPDERQGGVVLVLGAGNVASIPPADALYKLFAEGHVVVLKMNPVNAHVGPFIERAWRVLVERDFLHVVFGGAAVGKYLVEHPLVDEIHITGGKETHEQIVWGPPGPKREARRRNHQPLLGKPISSELGNISPVIVVPGPYTAAELEAQGDAVAAAVANNASFNCNSAKLLVQAKGWSGRERFREAITASLERVPPRHAYYPGAAQRWHELVDTHPKARRIGSAGEGELPWALLPDLDPADDGEVCFHMEPWCSVISETAVGTDDPVDFIAAATRFVNERVWGTLVATVVIHPDTASEPRFAAALERALDELRYGTVSLNQWPAVGFALGTAPWGGYPSSTLEDIQSGRGWVRNAWLLNERDIEKVVIRAPLVPRPKPVWYAGHRTANALGKQIVAMEASPSVLRLPGLLWSVLRG